MRELWHAAWHQNNAKGDAACPACGAAAERVTRGWRCVNLRCGDLTQHPVLARCEVCG